MSSAREEGQELQSLPPEKTVDAPVGSELSAIMRGANDTAVAHAERFKRLRENISGILQPLIKAYSNYVGKDKSAAAQGAAVGAVAGLGVAVAALILISPLAPILATMGIVSFLLTTGIGLLGVSLGGLIGAPVGVAIANMMEEMTNPPKVKSQPTQQPSQQLSSTATIHDGNGLDRRPNPQAYASSSPQAAAQPRPPAVSSTSQTKDFSSTPAPRPPTVVRCSL